jgi:hypothetical protein
MVRDMALSSGDQAPYAPPGTVIEILRRCRERGLPQPLTPEVLERAGVSPTLSQRTLHTLKLLAFVDSEGKLDPEFEAANRAPDDEYKQRLGDLITGTYSEVINFADPGTDSYERVRDAFRGFNPRGQQDRMVTLFLGLLEYVGMDVGAATASRPSRRGTGPKQPTTRVGREPSPRGGAKTGRGTRHRPEPRQDGTRDAALVAWFDTRPDPETPWPSSDRDVFMKTLRAIVDGIYREPNPRGEPEQEGEEVLSED